MTAPYSPHRRDHLVVSSKAYRYDGIGLAVSALRAWSGGDPVQSGAGDVRGAVRILMINRMLVLAGPHLARGAPQASGVLAAIADFRRLTQTMNAANLMLMRRLMTLTAGLPAPVAFYKGTVLQQSLYGTTFARPSSDIDLLTAPRDYDGVAAALEQAGFMLNPHTATVWWRRFLAEQQFRQPGAQQSIDLHHRIQQPGCPLPKAPQRFLLQAQPRLFLGQTLLTFGPAHTTLAAAMSLVKALHHREPAGRYVTDIHGLTRALDAEQRRGLEAEAALQGLTRTLNLALRSAAVVYGGPSPTPAILPEVTDEDLTAMLLAPRQAVRWVKRSRLLQALCDTPVDRAAGWLMMIAGESARRAGGAPRPLAV